MKYTELHFKSKYIFVEDKIISQEEFFLLEKWVYFAFISVNTVQEHYNINLLTLTELKTKKNKQSPLVPNVSH